MNSKKRWSKEYDYDLMDQQLKVEIEVNPNFTINKHLENLQSWIDFEINEKNTGGDFDEPNYNHFIKTKVFWESYRRQNTILNNTEC